MVRREERRRLQPRRRAADRDRLRARPARAPDEAHEYLTALHGVLLLRRGLRRATWRRARCAATRTSRCGRAGSRRRSARAPRSRTSTRSATSRAPSSTRSRARSALVDSGARGRAGDAPVERRARRDGVRCAPRRRRTTTATSPSPTCRRWSSTTAWIDEVRGGAARAAGRAAAALRRASTACPTYDAGVLTLAREVADYFEAVAQAERQREGRVQLGDDRGAAQAEGRRERAGVRCPIAAAHLAELIRLIDGGTISGKIAKDVFETMWATGEAPARDRRARGADAGLGRRARSPPPSRRCWPRARPRWPTYRKGKTSDARLVRRPGDEADRGQGQPAARRTSC